MALPDVVVVVFYKGPNERTFSAIARVHVHATGIGAAAFVPPNINSAKKSVHHARRSMSTVRASE